LDVLLALALIGLALFVGAIVLRRAPTGVLVFGAIVVGFGVGIPALVIDDNTTEQPSGGGEAAVSPESGGGDQAPEESSAQTGEGGGGGGGGGAAASAEGKQIFTQSCGTCHTLSDAGTSGTVGPNLDELQPDAARVTSAIENGGAGTGAMPANIVTGQEAEAVAEYVSSVAGN
jgi:cytochrome c6